MAHELRPYQERSITEARQAFIDGHKQVILMLPTGAGKSIVIRKIIEMSKPNMRILFVVHRTILINQMRETLSGLNVEIQTLQKIGKNPTEMYDLVIHDECHYSWGSKLRNNLNSKFYLGLSATPTDADGYPLKCDKLITFMQMPDLVNQGYATPFKVLSTSKVDTKKLKKSGNDYNQKQAYELMAKSEIKKDILNVYNEHCKGKKTIIYAVNISHAEDLHKEFLEAGVQNEVIHSKKKTSEIIERFKNNETKVLINVSILTIGFDDGDIECLLLASPTKSVILAQQIYGRVSRLPISIEKPYGLIVDCANVIEDTCHPMQRLDFEKVKTKKKAKSCKKCKNDINIIAKNIKPIDGLTYLETITYRCSTCGFIEDVEEYKVINMQFCDGCANQLLEKNMQYRQTDNAIEFYFKCDCGHEKVEREVLLTDKELKVLEHEETMNTVSWDRVAEELKAECKRCGYKWQYSKRLLEHLQSKQLTPEQSLVNIETIRAKSGKISALMYA